MRRFFLIVGKVFSQLTGGVGYLLSGFIKRDKNIWVFGSGNGTFEGNSKFLFLWLIFYHPELRVFWITKNKRLYRLLCDNNLPVKKLYSIGGIFICLRSAAYFYTNGIRDISFPTSRGALLVNLWHGVGIKKFGLQGKNKWYKQAHTINKIKQILPYGEKLPLANNISNFLVISPSILMQKHFSKMFAVQHQFCLRFGYPRLDYSKEKCIKEFAKKISINKEFILDLRRSLKTYIYMPTFRDSGKDFLPEALPDIDFLNEILKRNNSFLYLKLHSSTQEDFIETENIKKWPSGIDFQLYLDEIDGLITDYSSVLYDFLMIGKGIPILYPFDFDKYKEGRDLAFPYTENVTGVVAYNFQELCRVLEAPPERQEYQNKIEELNLKFWGAKNMGDMTASEEIFEYISTKVGL